LFSRLIIVTTLSLEPYTAERTVVALSATKVKNLKKRGLYADEKNLYLQVTDTGTKSWIFRYTRNKKLTNMGLGPYPDVKLAEARELAYDNRKLLRSYIDPLEEKKRLERSFGSNTASFAEVIDDYIKAKSGGWTEKHKKQFRNTVTTYGIPTLKNIPIDVISTQDILKVLRPIWEEKNETASRVRGRIEMVLDFATATGLRTGDNPARWKGHLSHLLAKRSSVAPVTHMASIPYQDMYGFMVDLRSRKAVSRACLELCILTAARIGSVGGARWDEVEGKVWTIPAERMKGDFGEFKVPLSKAALKLIENLPQIDDSPYLFPGGKGHINLETPRKLLQKDMGYPDFTVHGFRSTFRDWSAELTNHPNHICEMALAHTIGSGVEKAYRRGDMFNKRAKLMEDWAKFLNRKPALVTSIKSQRKTHLQSVEKKSAN
jgi:integrase